MRRKTLPNVEHLLEGANVAEETRLCPKCGNVGSVKNLFGTRTIGGKVKAQSYCKTCRSNYVKESSNAESA
jgi:hypothetical protein